MFKYVLSMILFGGLLGGGLIEGCGEESKPPGSASGGSGGSVSVGDASSLCSTGCAHEIECGRPITREECEALCVYRATVMRGDAFTAWTRCLGSTSCEVLSANPDEEEVRNLDEYCYQQLACRREEGPPGAVEEVCTHYVPTCSITMARCTQNLAFNGCLASNAVTTVTTCLDNADPGGSDCFLGVVRSSPGCGGWGGGGGD